MPPEQLRGHELDHRADLYALGVVLYEMLTGRTPHIGDSPFEVAAAALTEPVIPPSQLNPQIPPAVEAVILRALRPNAAERYANVMSFVEALQAALAAPAPALPLPEDGVKSLPALARRRERLAASNWSPAWWVTATLIALGLLVVSGGVSLLFLRGNSGGANRILRIDATDAAATATQAVNATVNATANVGVTATVSAGTTITPGSTPGSTPSATAAGTATAVPTATAFPTPTIFPTPTATLPSPPPLLTLSSLHLSHTGGQQCAGSQMITNSGPQTNTWVWDSVQPSPHSSFVFGVNTPAQFGGFPGDLFPGIPPRGK
jgi:serine/threonine protein kinase